MIVTRVACLVLVLASLSASVAGAQTATTPDAWSRRVFLDGAVLADYDSTDFVDSGPARGGGFGIGSRLWRRYSVRFEVDIPATHVDLSRDTFFEHRWSMRTLSYAFLVGRHFRTSRKVQVVTLVGISALTHRSRLTGFFDVTPTDGRPPTHTVLDDSQTEQWVALSAGLEVPIALSPHLQLVPQLRQHIVANEVLGQLFQQGSVVRARMSLRWQF